MVKLMVENICIHPLEPDYKEFQIVFTAPDKYGNPYTVSFYFSRNAIENFCKILVKTLNDYPEQ